MFTALGIVGGLAIVGTGVAWWFFPAVVVAILTSKAGKLLLSLAVIAVVLWGVWHNGLRAGREEAKAASLRTQIAVKTIDLQIQGNVAARLAEQRDAAEAQSNALQETVNEYAEELKNRPATAACLLNDADVRRLRSIR